VPTRSAASSPEEGVVGGQVRRRPLVELLPLARAERHAKRLGDARGHVGLHLEDVGECGVEGLLPLGRGGAHLDQLGPHFDPVLSALAPLLPAHLAHEEVVDAEFPPDLLRALRRPLVLARAAGGRDLEGRQRGQLAPDRVGDAVGEVFVLGGAEVLEGEHRDAFHTGAASVHVPRTVAAQPPEQHPETDQDPESERHSRRGHATACGRPRGGRTRWLRRDCRRRT
jgi:hypothetical protein